MQKERIPSDPNQSFRLFSWEESLENIHLHSGHGESTPLSGLGNVWHYHPEIELTFFTQGEGIHYIGDDISAFESPELVLLGSNLPHHWDVDHSSGYCIQFSFTPSSPLAGLHESSDLTNLLKQAERGLLFSKNCQQDILPLIEECIHLDPILRLTHFLQILHRLSKARATALSSYLPQAANQSKSPQIKNAIQFIVENATREDLSLSHVLDHVSMSRATFSRQFQKALGLSYTNFIQSIRLETARRLLTTTNQSITEIAYASGFSNLSHFNALFRKRWNMAPSSLRKKL
ncbi:helix-turn-helix domain-containing protein [Rubritalea tangerina]|uniref:Helix-turn-helix domain-containing protein n=1 Tax=Rubritalea tangerina TaxID=430798 RepID=A0ABW4ZB44_9BACT